MHADSMKKTYFVATLLCIVCSVLVSVSAVKLKPFQEENKAFDIKKKLLVASGLVGSDATKPQVYKAYEKIKPLWVELSSGEVFSDEPTNEVVAIPSEKDIAGIRTTSKYAKIFLVQDGIEVTHVVFPVYGKGLWSTMYGFLALTPDFKEVKGMGFYDHGETPGLGGEIENPKWLKSWIGKKAYDQDFNPLLAVIKGKVDLTRPESSSQIDGLAGATLTAVGVDRLVKFWLGESGFKKFVETFKAGEVQ